MLIEIGAPFPMPVEVSKICTTMYRDEVVWLGQKSVGLKEEVPRFYNPISETKR